MRLFSLAVAMLAVAAGFAIGRVTALPIQAAVAGPMAATTFSHFECYQATFQGQFSANVELGDQFQKYQTSVGAPQLFCTPVAKTVLSGPKLKVPSPANHLTCYAIKGPTPNQARPYANQFVKGQVNVGPPSLLCVPTNKSG
jgi:hypothetical protein